MTRTMKVPDSSTTGQPADKIPAVTFAEKIRLSRLTSRAVVKRFSCLVLLFLSLTLTSCIREYHGCAGDIVIDNHFLKGLDPDNARFELPTAAVQPASLLWMKKGEVAGLRWDTFEWHWQQIGSMCTFTDNTSTNDCSICDYCTTELVGPGGGPCFGVQPLVQSVEVFASEGGSDATLVEGFGGNDFVRGCPSYNADPTNPNLSFEPQASGFYELRLPAVNCSDKIFARTSIRLVEADNPQTPDFIENTQTTAYQLIPQTVDGTRYWTWSVTGDPKWLENFSRNLRITGISIRKGRCVTDPVSGSCVPAEESPAVTASRILFLPDFQGTVFGHPLEATNRCYAHPSAIENGVFIDLAKCRNTNSPDPLLPTSVKTATPTYDHTEELAKLTWLLDFNTGEGGDADLTTPCNRPTPTTPGIAGCDAPDANEDFIIVFTIAAR